MSLPTLAYSLADQHFRRTKSVGILNLSQGLLHGLLRSGGVGRLTVLANHTLPPPQPLPPYAAVRWHDAPVAGRLRRFWWDQWGVYRAAVATGMEWLFLPKGFASFARRCPIRLAAYVHDTIPFYYRRHYPHAYPKGESWYFCRCFRATLRQARVIFTNSEFTRQSVLQVAAELGERTPPVVVAGIGFEAPTTLPPHKEERIVCLAAPWPHKLTMQAVELIERWRVQSHFTGSIEVVGRTPHDLNKPSAPAWRWHERLPLESFAPLVAGARALIYFSAIEGFGMPPVEAVLAGTCPVFSDIPAHREVMGDAGFSFKNDDYAAFELAMEEAFGVTPEHMANWKTALLARHNWGSVTARVLGGLV